MQRNYDFYLKDIVQAINKIEKYTKNMSFKIFLKNDLCQDGVVKNLEVIGEAVKHLPEKLKSQYSEIDWKKIAGIRDILVHEYFGIDFDIVWDIVQNKLPILKKQIQQILDER